LNKYLSNLSEHHDMYVPLLLGFRLGDRNADDMSITGRELDLDNTKLGDGRWEERGARVLLCCGYWYLVFGGYTRPARSVSGKKAHRAGTRHFALRGKGVYVTKSGPSRDYKSSNITTTALSQTSSRSNYRSQSSYISPLDSPLRVSHVSHERHPTH
jgi:hypothetical protein